MSTLWRRQAERSTPAALMAMIWIATHLGRRVSRVILLPVVLYFYLTGTAARRASRDYLARVLPQQPTPFDVLRHIYTFAVCTLDRVYMLAGHEVKLDIKHHDPATVLKPQTGSRGCLMLVSHVGSFDVLRVLGNQRKQLSFRILLDRAQNQRIQDVFQRLNPRLAGEVIDAGEPGQLLVLKLKQAADAGQMVGIMADRLRGSEASATVDFLGGKARFPTSPWAFASVLKVPVVLCFGLYRGGNRYDLHFEQLEQKLDVPRAERAALLQQMAQFYADRLAHHLRSAPYNWFNFYDFWNDEAAAD